MEKTAVEWLADWMNENNGSTSENLHNAIKQAKEMEKEQKISFANQFAEAVMGGCMLTPTEFYNETFKSE